MPTLKQSAQAAGVSTTTVSNVINGNLRRVSGDTAERVRAIIRQTGYIRNEAARALAQRETRLVAVNMQTHGEDNALLNPYSAVFIGALTARLYHHGFHPLLRFSDDFQTVEEDIVGWNVAGAIFNGSFTRYLTQIRSLTAVPTVLTDCYYDLPGVNRVDVDDAGGGRVAGEYLSRMGHRRVAFVANSPDESAVEKHRLAGLRGVIDVPDRWVIPFADIAGGGRLDALTSGDDRPTAFFCASDLIAIQLIRALGARGLRVPEDASVLGFDDLPMATVCTPQLTTVAQDIGMKAQLVVDMLVRHIRDKSLPPERATLGVRLVERESVRRMV